MSLINVLKQIGPLRRLVRTGRAIVHDWRQEPYKQQLFGDKAYMVPPPRLMHDGPADYQTFKENGRSS